MTMIPMISLLAIGILCFMAGVVKSEVPQQIGGRDITAMEFRWFVAIRRAADHEFHCSGVLIGSRYVLTAGHCIGNVSYFCSQRTNCFREHEFLRVRGLFRHATGDLALLALDGAVNACLGIQPAVPYIGKSMHPSQKTTLSKKSKMKMIGAGREGTRQDISLYVKELDVKYMSPKKCRKEVKNPAHITDTVVCSVAKKGNPCGGESGSDRIGFGSGWRRKIRWARRHFGNSQFWPCGLLREDQPLGHFRMSDAASLIQSVVCEGDYPEDWCQDEGEGDSIQPTDATTPTPTQPKPPTVPPSASPTQFYGKSHLRSSARETFVGHTPLD